MRVLRTAPTRRVSGRRRCSHVVRWARGRDVELAPGDDYGRSSLPRSTLTVWLLAHG